MSVNLKSLYEFRVKTPHDESMQPNRRRAAKAILSFVNKGYHENQITCERRVKGQWVIDQEAYDLFEKYANAPKAAKNGAKPKTVTLKSAIRELAQACKLALATDELSEDHADALFERMNTVRDFLMVTDSEPDPEEDEDETEDSDED